MIIKAALVLGVKRSIERYSGFPLSEIKAGGSDSKQVGRKLLGWYCNTEVAQVELNLVIELLLPSWHSLASEQIDITKMCRVSTQICGFVFQYGACSCETKYIFGFLDCRVLEKSGL